MNSFANTSNTGLLKNAYPGKGPISQMNNSMPMLAALRKKRDAIKTK